MLCMSCRLEESRPGELYCEECHQHPEWWMNPEEWDAYPYAICPTCGEAYLPVGDFDPPNPPICLSCELRLWAEAIAELANGEGS